MTAEDKKRTAVFNFDVKPCGSGDPGEFYALYGVTASAEPLDRQLKILRDRATALKTEGVDRKDPRMMHMGEMVKHLKEIKKNSYFIDDVESIDKLVTTILDLTFNPDVDRIVTDTLTSCIEFCDLWANANFTGHDIWGAYGNALQRIMQAIKEATLFGFKYTWVMAHHDYIAPALYNTTPKQAVSVKGNIMKGNIEQHYSTVVLTYQTEEGSRMFSCSNNSTLDTSRTKLDTDGFTFKRESLDDLEQSLAAKKKLDGKTNELVDI